MKKKFKLKPKQLKQMMKMKNKVLVRLIVPELDEVYDLFIPVNEVIWKIMKLLI